MTAQSQVKYLSLKTAKEKAGSKHALAMNCKISPAAVSKAFNEEIKMGYKVRILNDGTWEMVYPQAPWHVVTQRRDQDGLQGPYPERWHLGDGVPTSALACGDSTEAAGWEPDKKLLGR
jgi:hypothetical protein